MRLIRRVIKFLSFICLLIFIVGLILPHKFSMPVAGATQRDYNHESFWYYPWGKSVVHKGVDISATRGIVLYAGNLGRGGNAALILGPKWRLHYYAHLNEVKTKPFSFVSSSSIIGTVGTSGNAANTPPHLHYSIATLIPYPWRIDNARQGWKKIFYLNPVDYLN